MTFVTAHYILPCGLPGWVVPVTLHYVFLGSVVLSVLLSLLGSLAGFPCLFWWFFMHV